MALTLRSPPLRAQPSPFDWRPANFQIAQLLKQGRYDEALPLIEQTARNCPAAATRTEAGLCTAILSENRAEVLEHRGDLLGAEAGLRRTIAERARVLPATDKLVVEAWKYLILFFGRHDRLSDQETALASAERLALADPAQAQDALFLMLARGNVLMQLGRPAVAIDLYRRAIAFGHATPGVGQVATVELSLANALHANGETDAVITTTSDLLARKPPPDPATRLQAAALLGIELQRPERARALLPLLEATREAEAPAIDPTIRLAFLNGLSYAVMIAGDHARALDITNQAQRLAIAIGGPHSKLRVQPLRLQAGALERLGRVDEALDRLAEARAILDSPADLVARADLVALLATHLHKAGRSADLERVLAAAAQETLRATPSRDKAVALTRIGTALNSNDLTPLAQAVCDEAVRLDGSGFALGPAWLSKALVCLANSQFNTAPAAAYAAAQRALAVLQDSSTNPPATALRNIHFALFISACDDNRLPEALRYAQTVLTLSRQLQDPSLVAEAWWYIASVQRRAGDFDAALASAEQGLAVVPADAAEAKAALLNGRGLTELYLHRPAEALATLQQALDLRRSLAAPNPFLVGEGEGNVATILAELGRTSEAAAHLDAGLALYRKLGAARAPALIDMLVRRAHLAQLSGDPASVEACLREALAAATSIGSPQTPSIRFALADALDRKGEFAEAASLHADALAALSSRFGADSPEMANARLADAQSLLQRGNLAEAAKATAGCEAQARDQPSRLAPCLSEQARIMLARGEPGRAGDIAASALREAGAAYGAESPMLLEPLLLQGVAAADSGDANQVATSLDRVQTLLRHDPAALARLALTRGNLLAKAGDRVAAETSWRQAETDGDLDTIVGVARARGAALIAAGKPAVAEAGWNALLSRLDPASRLHMTASEGLGEVAVSRWRFAAAASLFGDVRSLSARLDGAFAAHTRDLAIAQARSLALAGDMQAASAVLAPLAADPNPLTAFLRETALAQAASASGDPAAALVHAREALRRAQVAFDNDGLVVGLAKLKLAAAQITAGETPPFPELNQLAVEISARKLAWSVTYEVEHARGLLAWSAGQSALAEAAFQRAETVAAEHAGPGSSLVAIARANRGLVRLAQGDAAGADTLLQQSLAFASPTGEPHGPLWASIALAAATAARRIGDPTRAQRLETEAAHLLPPRHSPRQLWL